MFAGGVLGIGSLAVTEDSASAVTAMLKSSAVSAGFVRANTPQSGAYYRNCDAARAAGVAPLYAGEPGYRSALDRDGDGIACEPFLGR